MTDLVYDFVSSGVDLLMASAILASIVILLRSTNQLSQISANQQMVSDRINYYREFNGYDNNDVTGTDVVGAIVKYYQEFDIVVYTATSGNARIVVGKDGTIKEYNSSGALTGTIAYSTGNLQAKIPSDYKYHAYIYENGSTSTSTYYEGGVLSGLMFRRK